LVKWDNLTKALKLGILELYKLIQINSCQFE